MKMHRTTFLLVVLFCSVTTSSCGNYLGDVTLQGRTGITLSETGDMLIRVQPCGLPIDVVDVSGPMEKTEKPQPNPVYLQVHDNEGRPDPFILDPRNIESGWVVEVNKGLPTDLDEMIIINSRIEGQNSQTSQVSALIGDVLALKEGMILTGSKSAGSRIVDEEEFLAC